MEGFLRRARDRVRTWLTPAQGVAGDAGSATTDWILIIMVSITIATVVGGILIGEFTTAAKSIDLGVNR
ncbi:hypothetical protein HNR06_000917 [Nocardiopsis arvandica]|uniref:Uncharacterized protein n=1 Tax=Nocardiopsis sinuspersici TaxID=501010 RepID=A0A7Y9XB44_9ACTN|nr:hypothetical protein [Nocardiopsis sinuspersici]NYH51328.1 hypothetical protein [Nocardiopsis sinuspersici]